MNETAWRSKKDCRPSGSRHPRAALLCTIVAVLFSALVTPSPAWAQAKRLELSDLKKLVSVSDPQISPDGKSIVCVVSHMNFEQDRHDAELVLIDIATGSQRPLTSERKRVSSPQWSPSGDRLAFLALDPSAKEKTQVFILSMNGGDSVKLTDTPNGVEQFAWRPDGQEIAYVTSDEPENKKEIEAHNDSFEVGDDDFLNKAAPTSSHIWLISADGGKPRRLTSGPWSLPRSAPPSSPASPISWSPDGRYITFAKQENPHYGDSDLATIQIVDVASGEIRKLTKHAKLEGFGEYSPDGSHIAYWYPRDGDPNNENEIYVTPSAGEGDGVDLTRTLDRDIVRAEWMPGGKSLLVGGHDGASVALWIQPLEGKPKRLQLDDVNPSWLFWVDVSVGKNGAIVFSGSAPNHPNEIYYMDSPDAKPRRLTDFNHDLAALSLGRMEELEWQGPDGFHEDGVVIWPPEFDSRKKYPLVLAIHGGPTSSSTLSFTFLTQLLASRDYIVFLPNYRGSDNLGNAYQRAIFNDAGDGPGRDVMAGIETLEKMGHVDKSKIAVSGWSYGGYMTSWMIGHYHIWKTAVAGASVTDMVHAYNLSDFNVTQRYAFGGSPWTGDFMKAYREQSPITYAADIKTPTLILSDTADARVPITQSYFLYHAMKDNGVTVQFFAYPVPGHFPGDPVRTSDVYRRWVGWIDQYLK